MLSKKVDATLGAFWNYEGVELAHAGRKPNIMRIETLGVPTYNELVVAARQEDLDEAGGSTVRRFLQATARGYALRQGRSGSRASTRCSTADKSLDRDAHRPPP